MQTVRLCRVSSAVASAKRPATISAFDILLSWPDRSLALGFVRGSRLLGAIEAPCISREIPIQRPSLLSMPALVGDHAQQVGLGRGAQIRTTPVRSASSHCKRLSMELQSSPSLKEKCTGALANSNGLPCFGSCMFNRPASYGLSMMGDPVATMVLAWLPRLSSPARLTS